MVCFLWKANISLHTFVNFEILLSNKEANRCNYLHHHLVSLRSTTFPINNRDRLSFKTAAVAAKEESLTANTI
jgi:hypothetical protein